MEFTIRMLVVIVFIIIVFVVLVALIGIWGGDASAMIKGLSDWFSQILKGQAKIPSPQTGSPGTGLPGSGTK